MAIDKSDGPPDAAGVALSATAKPPVVDIVDITGPP